MENELMSMRSWYGILTNMQKNDLHKKYFVGTDKCYVLENHPFVGMITYSVDDTDENILIMAKGERIKCIETVYTLPFYEALKEMLEKGKWIKGENFNQGMYLKTNLSGDMVAVDGFDLYKEIPYPLCKSLSQQKYRIVEIATKKELSY